MNNNNNNNAKKEFPPKDIKSPEYLAQLLSDKKQMQAFPNVFLHAEKLLDEGVYSVVPL